MTACDRSSLVEASFDGRLGPSERLSLERHLATCPACSAERRELELLRAAVGSLAAEISPLEHQRARLGLLRSAAAPARAPARRRVALVAAALVFIPVAVWAARATVTPPRAPEQEEEVLVPAPVPTLSVAPVVPVLSAAPVPAEPEAPAPAPALQPKSHASRDFAEAMDAIARGDFGAGAAKLDRFAQENPTDPRAEEALYLEAVALERAGRIAEAKIVATRYLAAYPDGAHRARAQRLISN